MLDPKIYGTLTPGQMREIKGSDIKGLVALKDICHAARAGAFGVGNQPRCSGVVNRALETLVTDRLDLVIDTLMEELENRAPKTRQELELRNECLAHWNMQCGAWPEATKWLVDLVSNEKNLPERID